MLNCLCAALLGFSVGVILVFYAGSLIFAIAAMLDGNIVVGLTVMLVDVLILTLALAVNHLYFGNEIF